jgi:hypothetical protein
VITASGAKRLKRIFIENGDMQAPCRYRWSYAASSWVLVSESWHTGCPWEVR